MDESASVASAKDGQDDAGSKEWQTELNTSVEKLPSRLVSAKSNTVGKRPSNRNSFDSGNIRFRIRLADDNHSKIVEQISENAGELNEVQSVGTKEQDLLLKL